MNDTPKIVAARGEVTRAKAELVETARLLQQRLQPRTLANEAWEAAKTKGADLAEDAVDAVKRRPVAASGIVAALAMFLARDPIKDGVAKIYDAMTSPKDKEDPPVPPPAPRRKRAPARSTARKTEKA